MKSKWMVAAMLLLCVCIISQGVLSQPQGRGQGRMMMGQGRGGGRGMMGQGRGMMGQGMMGQGRGMMGQGMMMRQMHGGMGQGQRVRAMGPLDAFDAVAEQLQLTKAQQTKIAKLRADAMKKLLNDINGVLSEKQKVTFAQAQDRLGDAQKDRQGRGPGPMSEGRPTGGGRSQGQRRGQRGR